MSERYLTMRERLAQCEEALREARETVRLSGELHDEMTRLAGEHHEHLAEVLNRIADEQHLTGPAREAFLNRHDPPIYTGGASPPRAAEPLP